MKKFIAIAFGFTLLMAWNIILSAADEKNPLKMWEKPYNLYQKAEETELSGDRKKALEMFKECLKLFKTLQQQHPYWHKKALKFRIRLCKRKISYITAKLKNNKKQIFREERTPEISNKQAAGHISEPLLKNKESVTKFSKNIHYINPTHQTHRKQNRYSYPDAGLPNPTATVPGSISQQVAKMEQDLRECKQRIINLLAEQQRLQALAQRTQQAEAQVKDLLSERDSLLKKNALLLLQVDKLKKQTPHETQIIKSLKEECETAKLQTEALHEEIKGLLEENKKLKKEKLQLLKEKTAIKVDYNALSEEFEKTKKDLCVIREKLESFAKLNKEITVIKNKNRQLTDTLLMRDKEIKKLKDLLKELKKASNVKTDEKLKNENIALKEKILTLQTERNKLAKELQNMKKQYAELNNQITALKGTLVNISKQKQQYEKDSLTFRTKLTQTLKIVKEKDIILKTLKEKNKKLNDELKKAADLLDKLKNEKNKIAAAVLKEKNKELLNLKKEVTIMKKKLGDTQSQLEKLKKVEMEKNSLEKQYEKSKSLLVMLEQKLRNKEILYNKLQKQYKAVQENMKKLVSKNKKKKAHNKKTQDKNSSSKSLPSKPEHPKPSATPKQNPN